MATIDYIKTVKYQKYRVKKYMHFIKVQKSVYSCPNIDRLPLDPPVPIAVEFTV